MITPTKQAEKKNAKKKKDVKTTEDSAKVTNRVLPEPINVLLDAVVAVDKEGSEPSICAPTSTSRTLEEEEEQMNDKEESGNGDEDDASEHAEVEGALVKKLKVTRMPLM
ncbi:hypothetical protein Bca4012_010326 [Brassica carinata]|uniref:Uncharacterized protein n=1 Tax=Brassica carinata TaxID=52824 RepID=A0A8X7S2X8_BRACI|nr:hypothetical protein Bca52824_035285 [Brassica carinata]